MIYPKPDRSGNRLTDLGICAAVAMLMVLLAAPVHSMEAAASQARPAAAPEGCPAGIETITAFKADGRRVPLYRGRPGKLVVATNIDWQTLSPGGKPVRIKACFHEGYLQVEAPHLEACGKEDCWIASRWATTNVPQTSQLQPCPQLPTGAYAASRDVPIEKCVR